MDPKSQVTPPFSRAFLPLLDTLPFFAPDAGAMRHKPLCHSRSQRVACAQALLFGRAKRAARERGVNGEGPRLLWRPILDKIFLSSRHKFMPSRPLLISPIHRVNSSSRQVISLSRRVISSCRLYYLQVHYSYILQWFFNSPCRPLTRRVALQLAVSTFLNDNYLLATPVRCVPHRKMNVSHIFIISLWLF